MSMILYYTALEGEILLNKYKKLNQFDKGTEKFKLGEVRIC